MRPLDRSFVRSVLLPANLIVAALVICAERAFTVEGDLRRVSREVDPDLPRPPADGAAGALDASRRGTLTVRVTGARDASGRIAVMLFDQGPLTSGIHVVAQKWVPASPQGSAAVFEDLPYGWYAVVAYHDANGNGDLDMKGPGGPPAEGIGNSGSRGPAAGPPVFEDSRIVLDREALEIEIPLHYL